MNRDKRTAIRRYSPIMKRTAAGVAAVLLLVAGCSSDGGGGASTPATPSDTFTPPSVSAVPSIEVQSSASPTEIPGQAEAVDWVSSSRLQLEAMGAAAADVRRALRGNGNLSSACAGLTMAAFSATDGAPKYGTDANRHPLIQAILDATSAYTIAASGCYSVSSYDRSDLNKGDRAFARAERLAKKYGTSI